MFTMVKYTLLDDGFWETQLEVSDEEGNPLLYCQFHAVNRIPEFVLLEFKRHALATIEAYSEEVI